MTIVELLVVLGILMIVVGFLGPALSMSIRSANAVKCRAQLAQMGVAAVAYANDNHGHVVPLAWDRVGREIGWETLLFNEHEVSRRLVLCPTAAESENRSYIMNLWLWLRLVRIDARNGTGVPASEIVLVGENHPGTNMQYVPVAFPLPPDDAFVDPARHGLRLKSNILWLDMHVSNDTPRRRFSGFSAWDVPW
jgi:hypothetical protein